MNETAVGWRCDWSRILITYTLTHTQLFIGIPKRCSWLNESHTTWEASDCSGWRKWTKQLNGDATLLRTYSLYYDIIIVCPFCQLLNILAFPGIAIWYHIILHNWTDVISRSPIAYINVTCRSAYGFIRLSIQ